MNDVFEWMLDGLGEKPDTLIGLTNWALWNRKNVIGTPCPYAQTGEEYIEILVQGETEDAAIAKLCDDVVSYVNSNVGAIYWRCMPEYRAYEHKAGAAAYARLLVSDKPVIWPASK